MHRSLSGHERLASPGWHLLASWTHFAGPHWPWLGLRACERVSPGLKTVGACAPPRNWRIARGHALAARLYAHTRHKPRRHTATAFHALFQPCAAARPTRRALRCQSSPSSPSSPFSRSSSSDRKSLASRRSDGSWSSKPHGNTDSILAKGPQRRINRGPSVRSVKLSGSANQWSRSSGSWEVMRSPAGARKAAEVFLLARPVGTSQPWPLCRRPGQ